ncbi:hypothetical protein ABH931_007177 [Streptacidiphilus sp. MAP12-33]|uniref:hypothetical protein n=1 Tax=Streptacidiphilus sp. MAP12-33 TaxID=3156266 RepID=UPI0035143437
MSTPDALLVEIATTVEAEQTNQMPLTVLVHGAVITGRLVPEDVWRSHVAGLLRDSELLGPFAAIFMGSAEDTRTRPDRAPAHLHFHRARILQGQMGIPETGGMYRIAIKDVSAWTAGDFGYVDQ